MRGIGVGWMNSERAERSSLSYNKQVSMIREVNDPLPSIRRSNGTMIPGTARRCKHLTPARRAAAARTKASPRPRCECKKCVSIEHTFTNHRWERSFHRETPRRGAADMRPLWKQIEKSSARICSLRMFNEFKLAFWCNYRAHASGNYRNSVRPSRDI